MARTGLAVLRTAEGDSTVFVRVLVAADGGAGAGENLGAVVVVVVVVFLATVSLLVPVFLVVPFLLVDLMTLVLPTAGSGLALAVERVERRGAMMRYRGLWTSVCAARLDGLNYLLV
jgi:hypothetical protein